MINKSNRIDYIDIARGIVIVLMVLGHSYSQSNVIVHWLYSFHMPFFFIVSGHLSAMKREEQVNIIEECKSKLKTLILPYCIWGTLYQLFLAGLQILGGASFTETLKTKILLVLNLKGSAMWFLPVMFMVIMLFNMVKYNHRISMCLAIVLMSIGIMMPKQGNILEAFLRVCLGYFFVCVGFYGHKFYKKEFANIELIVLVIASLIFAFVNPIVDMAYRSFGNPMLYIINGFLGTWVVIQLSKKLEKFSSNTIVNTLKLWGKRSIVVLCLHGFIIQVIRLVDYKVFNSILSSLGVIEGIVITSIVMLMITVCMSVAVRFFGWTWGIRSKKLL